MTYRTATSGYWQAAKAGLALLMLGAVDAFLVRRGAFGARQGAGEAWAWAMLLLMHLGLVALLVYQALRARNSQVTVSPSGLELQNWAKKKRFIPWEYIVGVVLAETRQTRSLSVEVEEEGGEARLRKIGVCPWGSDALRRLRHEIIRRRGLSEVEPPKTFWTISRRRMWR